MLLEFFSTIELPYLTMLYYSIGVFVVAYLLAYGLLRLFFPFYSTRPQHEQIYLLQRTIGPIHGAIAGWVGLETIYRVHLDTSQGLPWPAPRGLDMAILFSTGYMIVDVLFPLYMLDYAMIAHHLVSFAAEAGFLGDWWSRIPPTHFATGVLIATEFSTVFLHLKYVLRKILLSGRSSKPTPTRTALVLAYRFVAWATLASWIFVRLVTFIYFGWHIWLQRDFFDVLWHDRRPEAWFFPLIPGFDAVLISGSMLRAVYIAFLIVSLFSLNIIWLHKLVVNGIKERDFTFSLQFPTEEELKSKEERRKAKEKGQ